MRYWTSNNGVSFKSGSELFKSSKMAEFDTTSYKSAIVICVFPNYLTLKNIVTLKSSLGLSHRNWHHSIGGIRVLFVFYCNYGHVFYCFWGKARYLSKIAIFSTPFLHYNPLPRWKRLLRIFSRCFSQPRHIASLSGDVNRFRKKSQLERVTDRQTDGNAILIVEQILRNAR